jgi:hypothetical protein
MWSMLDRRGGDECSLLPQTLLQTGKALWYRLCARTHKPVCQGTAP